MYIRRGVTWPLIFIIGGCSTTQLTRNTVDISSTIQALYEKQALGNLSHFIDEPYGIPSQVDIQTGTITTGNTITPSLSAPLTRGFSESVAAAAAVTHTTGATWTGSAAMLQGNQTWQQNWNVLPLSDANTLRNLRALYRYVVFDSDLRHEFLVPRAFKNGQLVTDPYFLKYPQCVLCTANLTVNPKLRGGWLYWSNDNGVESDPRMPPAGTATLDLGHYGNHELYITRDDFEKGYLSDFILFLLPNAEPAGGGGASGAGATGPRVPNSPARPNYGFPPLPVPPISGPQ
jgi:hypothetical protein